jgi:hypothetical protein
MGRVAVTDGMDEKAIEMITVMVMKSLLNIILRKNFFQEF